MPDREGEPVPHRPPAVTFEMIPTMMERNIPWMDSICRAIDQLEELALVTGRPKQYFSDQAFRYVRPPGHPRGRQYYSGAVWEMYAGYRMDCPEFFREAARPALERLAGQIVTLSESR